MVRAAQASPQILLVLVRRTINRTQNSSHFTPRELAALFNIVRGRYRQRTLLAAKSCSFKPARQHRAHHSSCALSGVPNHHHLSLRGPSSEVLSTAAQGPLLACASPGSSSEAHTPAARGACHGTATGEDPTRPAAAREVHARGRCAPGWGAPTSRRRARLDRARGRTGGARTAERVPLPCHAQGAAQAHAQATRTRTARARAGVGGHDGGREGEPTSAPRSRARARRTLPPGRRRGGAGVPAPAWEAGSGQAERRLQAGRQSRPGGGGARTHDASDARVRRRAGARGGCCAGVHGVRAARWRGGRGRRPTVGTAPPAPVELQVDASPVDELIWHAIGARGGLMGMWVGLSGGTVRARELGARCGGRIRTPVHPLAGHARSPRVPDILARRLPVKLRRRRRVPRLGPQPESHGANRTESRDRYPHICG